MYCPSCDKLLDTGTDFCLSFLCRSLNGKCDNSGTKIADRRDFFPVKGAQVQARFNLHLILLRDFPPRLRCVRSVWPVQTENTMILKPQVQSNGDCCSDNGLEIHACCNVTDSFVRLTQKAQNIRSADSAQSANNAEHAQSAEKKTSNAL